MEISYKMPDTTYMEKTCSNCSAPFEVTQDDLDFYNRVSPSFNEKKCEIPAPTHCPKCRQQRRLAWQNMLHLYHRKCDGTGQQIISNYAPNTPYKVYDNPHWWSDEWDAKDYGREMDFSRPFFEQFDELLQEVPLPNLSIGYKTCENSDYINFAGDCKNCYLIAHANYGEDCMYGFGVKRAKDCLDCLNIFDCELCYECIDCRQSYNLRYCQDCEGCSNSLFLRNCEQCKDCFGCINLRQKQYCIFNEQKDKATYESFIAQFDTGSYASISSTRTKFDALQSESIYPALQGYQNENVFGDHIFRSQNIAESFDIQESRDMKYCERIYNGPNSDCYDVDQYGFCIEQIYEGSIVGKNTQRCNFCVLARYQNSDLHYCYQCFFSQNLLGCISMKREKYCILNKQYTKEEYDDLAPKILEYMRSTGEYGEFFPIDLSPFGYNETLVMDFYPLQKEEVEQKKWKWHAEEAEDLDVTQTIQATQLPDHIDAIPEDVLNWALLGEKMKKAFKLVPQEYAYYQKHKIPVPRRHWLQRHSDRFARRNTTTELWDRNCHKCNQEIRTNWDPSRKEIVVCAECYLKEIY